MKNSKSKDVHTEHCCIEHGCKYNSPDCSVTTKTKKQSYPCEDCQDIFPQDEPSWMLEARKAGWTPPTNND